ncbi:TetR/AcrR family transcriptional regulator [Petrimonas sulfuriphila]|uniref:TetR/AcrR family transcriptional regulator n=1 Tax=Petrimonas sulfuriphila TaxID=285070 RepID=UPI0032441E41
METRKRKQRTKKDIDESINNAAIQLIEEKGFQNIAVTAIMQRAKIEPVVFYNRYDDLDNFMDEFVKKYDYWFSDIIKNIEIQENPREQYITIMHSLLDSLKENKVMQQLLRWELSTHNNTTKRTARLREFHTLPLVERYKKIFEDSSVEIDALSALIIGGIYYLVLHGDLSEFGGIDINSEEGTQRLRNAIEYLSSIFFSYLNSGSETMTIAKRMKGKGVEYSNIAEYTGLTLKQIEKL